MLNKQRIKRKKDVLRCGRKSTLCSMLSRPVRGVSFDMILGEP